MMLSDAIDTYVQRKRSDGISFAHGQFHLALFCRHSGDLPLRQISSRDVQTFLDRYPNAKVLGRARYFLLHRFFQFWYFNGAMPLLLLPPPPPRIRRFFMPHIYTRSEIHSLLKMTSQCQRHGSCVIDAETFRCLILAVYATGALAGEVLNLRIADLDLRKRRVTLPGNLVTQCRTIPICNDLREELQSFGSRHKGRPASSHFFLTKSGQAIIAKTLHRSFLQLRQMAGVVRRDGAGRQPRMRDLRDTFAVHRITSWIKQGANLNRLLPALSAYLGNASLESTERYLLLTPERFRKELNKLSPQRGRRHWRDDPALMSFLASL